jgi:hypothetical protein
MPKKIRKNSIILNKNRLGLTQVNPTYQFNLNSGFSLDSPQSVLNFPVTSIDLNHFELPQIP